MSPQYLAGMLDSDGSIGINRRVLPSGSLTFPQMVRVGHLVEDRRAIDLAAETFGGRVRPRRFQLGHFGRRPMIYWICEGPLAVRVLRLVSPFLLIKRRQAAACLQMARLQRLTPVGCVRGKIGRAPRPEALLKEMERVWMVARMANARAPRA